MSMQQVLEIKRGLQDDMAESKIEQERMQADLDASHVRNEELRRVNEELRRGLRNNQGQREHEEMEHRTPPNDCHFGKEDDRLKIVPCREDELVCCDESSDP